MGGGEENNDTKIIETFEEGEIEKKRDKWAAILLLFYSVKVALSNSRWINETNSLKRFHTDNFINKIAIQLTTILLFPYEMNLWLCLFGYNEIYVFMILLFL